TPLSDAISVSKLAGALVTTISCWSLRFSFLKTADMAPSSSRYRVELLRASARGRGSGRRRRAVRARVVEHPRRERDHARNVAQVSGHDERVALLLEVPELLDVVLRNAELHRLAPARRAHGLGHAAQTLGRRRRDCEDRLGLALRLVDLLLAVRLGLLDNALLVALRLVDLRVALALGRQDHGALLALRAHLLLHRREHVVRRIDVLDLVAQHLYAPRLGRFVELAHDVHVDLPALLERSVEIDLADLAAQRRLSELRNGEVVVRNAVRRARRVEHLQIQHAVDTDLHVVLRDADLLRNVDRTFLQVVLVGDVLHERHEDMEAGRQSAAVLPEQLDDERALLRDHDQGPAQSENDEECRRDADDHKPWFM